MKGKDVAREELEEYIKAQESQLDNVLSSPIGTSDYSLPSDNELNETIFLEDEIETAKDFLDLLDDDDDEVLKNFFGIK